MGVVGKKQVLPPTRHHGPGILPQDGCDWQCCVVNDPVTPCYAPVGAVGKSCWSYPLTWETLFSLCSPSLPAHESRSCFLWPVTLQEVR